MYITGAVQVSSALAEETANERARAVKTATALTVRERRRRGPMIAIANHKRL
jgi:hypothetical protein